MPRHHGGLCKRGPLLTGKAPHVGRSWTEATSTHPSSRHTATDPTRPPATRPGPQSGCPQRRPVLPTPAWAAPQLGEGVWVASDSSSKRHLLSLSLLSSLKPQEDVTRRPHRHRLDTVC